MKALEVSPAASSMIPTAGVEQIKAGIYDRLVRLETITGHPDDAKRWAEKARALTKGKP